jgi:hypothetical protein
MIVHQRLHRSTALQPALAPAVEETAEVATAFSQHEPVLSLAAVRFSTPGMLTDPQDTSH